MSINILRRKIMLPNIPEIQNLEKYSDFRVSREKLEHALELALKQIDKGIDCFGSLFPHEFSKNNCGGFVV